MNPEVVFINRRKGGDRRVDADPCKNLPLDLYHRKRRKSKERRAPARSLIDDYFAYQASLSNELQGTSDTLAN
ncbi:hypothetical protein DWB84_14900 [Saccharophagus sp. K07]|jgi:hypothetical protein|uniref:hypothetical protein n=1 Tax=Saccharophagus sp. K07 TaxID=2283636 RepID=UPI001651B90D|nr:hypothetical protein [Saccharophagus sp. K07]MBC6906739.1 hypothetical protein [Saccharophagus sp. K07]